MRYILLILLFAISGCATSINSKNATDHMQAATAAQRNGDWDSARKHWAKAVVNARLAGAPESTLAVFYYEYGRSLGATCYFKESEEYLTLAYEIDSKINGPIHMDLNELSLLNLDQGNWEKAVTYFEETITALDAKNMKAEAPYGYADVLDSYAMALEKSNSSGASEYRMKANEIRESNPGGSSITDRTPYGNHCAT